MTGWHMAGSQPRQYEHAVADEMTHEGKPVAGLRCLVPRADGFGTLMQTFSAEHFVGQRVRFSGALKCNRPKRRQLPSACSSSAKARLGCRTSTSR